MRAKARTDYYYTLQIKEDNTDWEIINSEEELTDINGGRIKDLYESEKMEFNPSEVELKEVELDQDAMDYLKKFKPQQQSMEVTVYEEGSSGKWFNFPEVDLLMKDRPNNGLYYVSGKILEKLDRFSAVASDGTAERYVHHQKVQDLNVGDVFIAQVQVNNKVWTFVNLWEVNESQPDESIAI